MKKQKSSVLVVACILFLLILIVLPPVFREYIPKEKVTDKTSTIKGKISILQCSKTYSTELYKVTTKVKYVNDVIKTNTIAYKKLETLPEGYQEVTATVPVVFNDEYTYLSNLLQVEKTTPEPNPTIVINSDTIESNPNDDNLKMYFQENISNQKDFYEERGFSCVINET